MTDAAAVRRVVLPLPRAVERQTGGRWKHYIGQIVFLAKHLRSAEWKSLSIPRRRATGGT